MTKFIVEHLDPRLWKWSLLEYKHISDIVGKDNIIFTNIKSKKEQQKLRKIGDVCAESVKELNFKNMCILDPSAKQTLTPEDKFDYILLGGILGDYPRKKRTKKELTDKMKQYSARNLGKQQMSTNTAAYVAWKIVNGTPLSRLKFKRRLVIKVNDCEEIILPFSFVEENGAIVLPEGYIELVKSKPI